MFPPNPPSDLYLAGLFESCLCVLPTQRKGRYTTLVFTLANRSLPYMALLQHYLGLPIYESTTPTGAHSSRFGITLMVAIARRFLPLATPFAMAYHEIVTFADLKARHATFPTLSDYHATIDTQLTRTITAIRAIKPPSTDLTYIAGIIEGENALQGRTRPARAFEVTFPGDGLTALYLGVLPVQSEKRLNATHRSLLNQLVPLCVIRPNYLQTLLAQGCRRVGPDTTKVWSITLRTLRLGQSFPVTFESKLANLLDATTPYPIDADRVDRHKARQRRKSLRYRLHHPERVKAQRMQRRSQVEDRISRAYSARIKEHVNRNIRHAEARQPFGCTQEQLRAHLSSQFEPGMTWDNRGGKDGWHIDHIIPCAAFDLKQALHRKWAWDYRNLSPRWGADNNHKSDHFQGLSVRRWRSTGRQADLHTLVATELERLGITTKDAYLTTVPTSSETP